MNGGEKSQTNRYFSKSGIVVLAAILFFVFFGVPILDRLQLSSERKRKYLDAAQRVERAGGWTNLEIASLAFVTNAKPRDHFVGEYFLLGTRRNTNTLPPALEALQPWRVEFRADSNGIPTIRLRLYGVHRTGIYDEPYYGIWVICTNVPPDYVPQIERLDHGMRGLIERKGHAIFEVR